MLSSRTCPAVISLSLCFLTLTLWLSAAVELNKVKTVYWRVHSVERGDISDENDNCHRSAVCRCKLKVQCEVFQTNEWIFMFSSACSSVRPSFWALLWLWRRRVTRCDFKTLKGKILEEIINLKKASEGLENNLGIMSIVGADWSWLPSAGGRLCHQNFVCLKGKKMAASSKD